MMILNEKSQFVLSVGFVSSLSIVGLSTHALVGDIDTTLDLVSGARQSVYEAEFEQGNPLNGASIAAMGAFKYAVLGQAETGAIVGKDGWLFTAEEFEVSNDFSTNLTRSADEIARIQAVLAQRGIALIPVIVPDKADVHADMLRNARPSQVVNRHAQLMAMLATRDVTALDAKIAMGAHSKTGIGFIKDDTHWTPAASRAVATLVASQHATMNIELTSATVTTTQETPVDFDGDLLKFVPTGVLRPAFGPPQTQIDRYTTTVHSNGGLFGDAPIDVALVGTSFSAKPEWNFAGFLQDALGADVLNFATQGQGPFVPMHTYLASDSFLNTPPKIVVWEIPARYTSKEMNL